MKNSNELPTDRRAQRTQNLIFSAFADFVQSKRYDRFSVTDIIERAGVGRSTFYDHFSDKNDVLLKSMDGLLHVLADTIVGKDNSKQAEAVLEHFWERRAVARILIGPPTNTFISLSLSELIRERLEARCEDAKPSTLCAAQSYFTAAGLVSVLEKWLTGKIEATPAELAAWSLGSCPIQAVENSNLTTSL